MDKKVVQYYFNFEWFYSILLFDKMNSHFKIFIKSEDSMALFLREKKNK